mgnify:CR=1 FL=1
MALYGKMPSVAYVLFCNNHMVHHRGQLSTYLRAMGGKVPDIYGGSADEVMVQLPEPSEVVVPKTVLLSPPASMVVEANEAVRTADRSTLSLPAKVCRVKGTGVRRVGLVPSRRDARVRAVTVRWAADRAGPFSNS